MFILVEKFMNGTVLMNLSTSIVKKDDFSSAKAIVIVLLFTNVDHDIYQIIENTEDILRYEIKQNNGLHLVGEMQNKKPIEYE